MTLLKELLNQELPGTYAGVRFSPATISNIQQYIKNNDIPNAIQTRKLHSTMLYSRKHLPKYKPAGRYDPPFIGTPMELDVWETNKEAGEPARCLVMKYKCDALCERHQSLRDEHDAPWDFPDYTPHITLSYDIGDKDVATFSDISSLGDIEIIEEYGEPLDVKWAKTKGTTDD